MVWRRGFPLIALLLVSPAWCQQESAEKPKSEGATLHVEPGAPAVEPELDHPVAPWGRFPKYFLEDQKNIWTSPLRTNQSDAKWWVIFGTATLALIATDEKTSEGLPNTSDQIAVAKFASQAGASYTLFGASGAAYLAGVWRKDEQLRETGFMMAEAVANTWVVNTGLKTIARRERPTEGSGNGRFFKDGVSVGGSSFPSGHATTVWAAASVVAHQYPDSLPVQIAAYGVATTVVGARFAARRHFASDVVAGAALGWFIGDYVFAKRHNPAVDPPRSKLRRALSHVRIGIVLR